MTKFLIDENLPSKFALWNSDRFTHVEDISFSLPDKSIWNYALENNLIIVTKDADFYNLVISNAKSPKVVHLRIGNMRIGQLH